MTVLVELFRRVERDEENVWRERRLTRPRESRDIIKPRDSLDCLDRENFVQRTQKMTSTVMHSILKKKSIIDTD